MIRDGNQLILLENGSDYFPALIAACEQARHEICLESYIFRTDHTGIQVIQALMAAARRGITVRVLLDGFGSRDFSPAWHGAMRQAGVDMLFFRPEFLPWRRLSRNSPGRPKSFLPLEGRTERSEGFWGGLMSRHRLRRLHRKLAVIDARIAFVGGINILSDFSGNASAPPRQDYAVQMTGPLVADVHRSALRLWRLVSWSRLGVHHGEGRWLLPEMRVTGGQRAEFLVRDNLTGRRAIENAYLHAIRSARQEIFLANAYFLPGVRFRHALVEAARRGVRVVLIMQGHTDHPVYRAASRALYRYFLENGVEVFEYHPSELHAKVAVIDGQWATVGSSNIDPLSFLLAREANVVIHDRFFAEELLASLETLLLHGGHRIHRMSWRRIPAHVRFFSWLAYGAVRLAMGILGVGRGWDSGWDSGGGAGWDSGRDSGEQGVGR